MPKERRRTSTRGARNVASPLIAPSSSVERAAGTHVDGDDDDDDHHTRDVGPGQAGAAASDDIAGTENDAAGVSASHEYLNRLMWNHCPVCNREMDTVDVIHTLECGHQFHFSCIVDMSELGWNRCSVCLEEVSDRAPPQPEKPTGSQCAVCLQEVAVQEEHTLNCSHKCHAACIASMSELGWDGCTACPTTSAAAFSGAGRHMGNHSAAAGKEQYLQLMQLDFVPNKYRFECPICLTDRGAGDGAVLKDCLHTFCKGCLAQTIEHSQGAEVKCPYLDANYSCQSVLQQREMKALVPQHIFEQHLARGVAQAESSMNGAFHCKTPDCGGWCVPDAGVKEFGCPVCHHVNCLSCQAVHEGKDCRTYQDERNPNILLNKAKLREILRTENSMVCPTCQVVIVKISGCNLVKCSLCKTNIFWATKGKRRREYQGDTSDTDTD